MSAIGAGFLDFSAIIRGEYPEGVPREECAKLRIQQAKIEKTRLELSLIGEYSIKPITPKFNESDLPKGLDSLTSKTRDWIVKTYSHLEKIGALNVLDLSEDELFKYEGNFDFTAHETIKSIAQEYMRGCMVGERTFGHVVVYLQILHKDGLRGVREHWLKSKLTQMDYFLDMQKEKIENIFANYTAAKGIKDKSPTDFAPGDFSFITDEMTRRILTNAYVEITKADKWAAFNVEKISVFELDKIGLSDVAQILADLDGHSGMSMTYTMGNMHMLHKKGWSEYVKSFLDKAKERAKQSGSF